MSLTRKIILAGIVLAPSLTPQTASALPFGTFDARTAAMGGVGVATGSRFASFNNPALLTTADEIHDWFLLFPTLGQQISDPDELEDGLDTLQQTATPAALNAVDGAIYEAARNGAVVLSVPSRILSGAAYINVYDGLSAQPRLGSNIASSEVDYRGFKVLENGVSAAKLFEGGRHWWSELAVGFNAKFMLVEGYGYSQNVATADLEIDDSARANGSAFNLDIGVLKEFGVFKLALVGKNLFASTFDYGPTGEQFEIGPQVRLGMAYQSRRAVLELDVDLTENEALGFGSATQIAALGWEYQLARWFALRAGYRQNMVDNTDGTASAGLGLLMGAMAIDIAGSVGDGRRGAAAQIGFQF